MPLLLIGAAVFALLIIKNRTTTTAAPSAEQLQEQQQAVQQQFDQGDAVVAAQIQAAHSAGLAVAGVAGAGVSAGLASLGYLTAAGPIGAAVAGAIAAIALLRGTTHLVANEFVQRVQNPFAAALSQIVDNNDQLIREGKQTAAGARWSYDAVDLLWREFKSAADQFALRDSRHRTVITQSYAELNGPSPAHNAPYFMDGWLASLARDVEDLSSGATPRAR